MPNQKGLISVILIFICVAMIGAVIGFFIYQLKNKSNLHQIKESALVSPSPSVQLISGNNTQSTSSAQFSDWKIYTSKQCHISFDYSGNWQVINSIDDPEIGCSASFGIPGDYSNVLIFSTPRGTTWDEVIRSDDKAVLVAGTKGMQNSNSKSFSHSINFIKGSIIFQFLLVNTNEYRDPDPIFEHIIQSVGFTGINSDYNQTFKTLVPLKN